MRLPKNSTANRLVVFLGMLRIHLIGAGNLAYHMYRSFLKSPRVNEVVTWHRGGQPPAHLPNARELPQVWNDLPPADITMLAIPDEQIGPMASLVPGHCGLLIHGSGASPIDILGERERKGVFYPLQTLSIDRDIPPVQIPVLIEASHRDDLELLKDLGESVFPLVREVSTKDRLGLHLAAVVANNFSNHLYLWSSDLCKKYGLEFEFLHPLIQETVAKVEFMGPLRAQTGPAIRGDLQSMERHLSLLVTEGEKNLYRQLSEAIRMKYEKELQGTPPSN